MDTIRITSEIQLEWLLALQLKMKTITAVKLAK